MCLLEGHAGIEPASRVSKTRMLSITPMTRITIIQQISLFVKLLVATAGLEPATHGFSIRCST